MKHKYNVGDKLLYIHFDPDLEKHHFSNETVELIAIDEEGLFYQAEGCCNRITEDELFTKPKAIEFLTNYINKTEE